MKAAMAGHVEIARNEMFNNATNAVRSMLDMMCARISQSIWTIIEDGVYNKVAQDYLTVLIGKNYSHQESEVPHIELMMRAEVLPFLIKADLAFKDSLLKRHSTLEHL
jgi:hypothetical protein